MPNMPATISIWSEVGARHVARAEDAQRHSGLAARACRATNADSRATRHRAEAKCVGRSPAVVGHPEDRVDAEHQRAGDEDRAERVGALPDADPLVAVDQPAAQGRRWRRRSAG